MTKPVYSIKIGGMAGQGIKSAGLNFSKIATRSGYHIYNYIEYPSLIRGGHNVMQTVFSEEVVTAPYQKVDLLIALNQETINLHSQEIVANGGLIYEGEGNLDISGVDKQVQLFPLPLKKIASTAGGSEIVINNVALGAAVGLMGGEFNHLNDLIASALHGKDGSIVQINQSAAKSGFNYAQQNYLHKFPHLLSPLEIMEKHFVANGTDAVALGAIAAGLQFASIYPMSPTSNILHLLAANQRQFGFVYKQVEDEISAINMAIGASFAGARSMTTTSGGGFCLMTEGYGLAGQTETPLVIIEGMRGSPGTGLPTWSEQGDLLFVLHAHQGDFPRIVLAAGDVQEAFELTMKAFNLAEKYQTPVILLLDKNILDHEQTLTDFPIDQFQVDRGQIISQAEENYHRYTDTNSGISPRTLPGLGNHLIANSDEHNSYGFSSELISDRNEQVNKRLRKLKTCADEDMTAPILIGPKEADITLVSWGSNKGTIVETLKHFPNVNYLHLTWMNPFPTDEVLGYLNKAHYLLGVECNSTAQLASLIREKTGIEILDKFLKNDGRPIFPEELSQKINSILKQS